MASTVKVILEFQGGGERYEFDLRKIRMFEQDELYAKLVEVGNLSGQERADAQLKVLKESLRSWATDAKAIDAIFETLDDADAERLANQAIEEYFAALKPRLVF